MVSLAVALVVAAVGLFAGLVKPGPVFWVDLYWTVLIERGVVDPTRDRYPWTVAVDWSRDRKSIVSAGYHPDVLLWDASSGKLRQRLRGHRTWVQEAIFSPDGARIASVDWGGIIMVWRAESGQPLHRLKADQDLFTVTFHPTREHLAAGSYQGTVTVFDLETGEVLKQFMANPGGTLFITYSPDGRLMAAAGEDARIHLLDAATYLPLARLGGHEKGITSVAFSRDGSHLLSCGDDGTARLWDPRSRRLLQTWDTGARWVNFCTLLPGDRQFLTGDTSGAVRLWTIGVPERGKVLGRHDDWVQCVRVSQDGKRAVSAGKAGLIKIWDLEGHRLVRDIMVGSHVQ